MEFHKTAFLMITTLFSLILNSSPVSTLYTHLAEMNMGSQVGAVLKQKE